MTKGVVQIELKDGRLYRVFYQNKTQETKLYNMLYCLEDEVEQVTPLTNGVHTFKQFQEIAEHF